MKAENYKSVTLVAREAAVEVMRRDVIDHGEDGSVRRALVDAWRESAERDFLGRIGFHLSQGEVAAVSMLNGAPYNPRMRGTPPTDAMWVLSPEHEVMVLELLGQEAPDTRPVFTTLARPFEVPALLLILPADTEILVRADFGGVSGVGSARVGGYVEYLEGIMRRQAEGLFTVEEAVQVLADALPGADVRGILKKMHKAYRDGKLPIRDPGDQLPKVMSDGHQDYSDLVKVSDIDAWLTGDGAGYLFPPAVVTEPRGVPNAAPATSMQCRDPRIVDDEWRELAQVEARRIINRQSRLGRFPPQEAIADEIAADFRNRTPPIHGTDGKPLSGATIKRHALKGISSATKKARATNINQGK